MVLSTAFHWDTMIVYASIFLLSLIFLGITEKDNKPASPRSCLVILLQVIALPIVLAIAAAGLILPGQQLGITGDRLIFMVSGLICLVGLALFVWSFRAAPGLDGEADLPTRR